MQQRQFQNRFKKEPFQEVAKENTNGKQKVVQIFTNNFNQIKPAAKHQ